MERYHVMLDTAIRCSGKMLKDIAKECAHRRAPINSTSLSKMRSAEQGPPYEPKPGVPKPSKNRVLAEVLGINPDEFILAAALEHTPLLVLEAINTECIFQQEEIFRRARRILGWE